jgi:hypothetical protein
MCISLDTQSNIYITKMYGTMSIKLINNALQNAIQTEIIILEYVELKVNFEYILE